MTWTERYVDFTRWPMSRRVVAVALIGLATTVLALIVNFANYASSATLGVDLHRVNHFFAFYAAVQVALILVTAPSARAGQDARWSAHLYTLVMCPCVAYIFHLYGSMSTPLYGSMSTPLVGIYTANVIVWMLALDETSGRIGLLLTPVCIAAFHFLEASGVLPYAPVVIDRSIDAQSSHQWFNSMFFGLVLITTWAFSLCTLMLSIRRLQERRLIEMHDKLERGSLLIRRYVPSQLADAMLSDGSGAAVAHERRRLTIFFSDLVGFTEIAEELEPEELSRVLNEYFSEMTAIANRFGGTIDELSGDAILIFFGAPVATDDRDQALRAARMAIEMQEATARLNAHWHAAGITKPVRARMGLDTGVVTVGNFGSQERMKYAVLGRHVNLAARLQSLCEPGRVLMSRATWLLVNAQVRCSAKGEVQLKGIQKPVEIYEVEALV
jgi:class 3 adenylate cyclase